MAHGLGDGLAGATVAASPSVALVGSYELLMMIIRAAAGLLSNQRSARETQDLRQLRAFGEHDGPHKYSGHARYRAWLLMIAGTPTTR